MVLISNHSYCSAGTFGGIFFIPTQCTVLKMMFVLLQVSQVNEVK